MKTTRTVTASRQLTRLFLMLFAIILVVTSLLFVTIVTNLIYRCADNQIKEIIKTVEKDWPGDQNREAFLSTYVARQDDDAIEITDGERRYTSPKARKTFKRIDHRKLALKSL